MLYYTMLNTIDWRDGTDDKMLKNMCVLFKARLSLQYFKNALFICILKYR